MIKAVTTNDYVGLKCLALFLVIIAALYGTCAASEKPEMLFFYSEDCDECKNVKVEFLPGFLEKYSEYFTFKELDVAETAFFDSLVSIEERFNMPEEDKDYPAVYFMGNMVEGEINIMFQLEPVVKAYIANPDSMLEINREVMSRLPGEYDRDKSVGNKPVNIAYLYEHGCKECGRALEIIKWLEKTYENAVVHKFDIGDRQSKIIAAALGIKSGFPEDSLMSTPSFFVGESFVLSGDISRKTMSKVIERYSRTGAGPVWENFNEQELQSAEKTITSRFESFSFFVVALAGLGDGVNPCAFATIVFFISYLTMIKRKGKEILLVGFSFALAVFVTYFLIGLGFFNIIKSMVNIEILAKLIFGGTALLCIVFGFLSIGDYFKARAGKTGDMSLQLPMFLKKRIHTTIREKARMKSIVAGALIAGFLVSVFEFACTGQVYLPVIIFMLEQSGSRTIAAFYLLVYNLFFIVPLLVVFGVVYMGVSSKTVAKVMEARVGLVKIVLAFVFFGVAALLLWSAF